MLTEMEVREALRGMETNPTLVTQSSFRANTEKWPDNKISFVENHIAYLRLHPKTNPSHYLSNLRLMLRKKA
jgi:hypothetical protein